MEVEYSTRSRAEERKRKDQLQVPVLAGMAIILQLLIYMVDRITNPDIAIGVGYIAVVLFSWLFTKNLYSILIAAFSCFLVVTDYIKSSTNHPDLDILTPNLFLSLGSIIVILILVVIARSQAQDIKKINNSLEDLVSQRTKELETKVDVIKLKNKKINNTQLDLIIAARRAKESEIKFKNLFEGVPDAIVIVDEEGIVISINKNVFNTFGYSEQELLGRDISLLIPNYIEVLEKASSTKTEGRNLTFEAICNHQNNEQFTAEVVLKQSVIGNKVLNNLAIRDITIRKEIEELLMVQAKSNEAKSKELEQFVYIASHDLQEPVRTISSFAEILTTDYAEKCDDEAKEMFRHINSSANRMTHLLKGLLEYGRLGRNPDKVEIDCNTLLQEVCQDLEFTIKESETIIQIDTLPTVNGFETELRVLFQNLINNSIKFRKPNIAPIISIGAKRLEDKWQFYVRDNGIGIDDKFKKKVFTIFQRLHKREAYEGYGVGLAQAKKIVELHNGEISVSSQPSVGSTFFFTINDVML